MKKINPSLVMAVAICATMGAGCGRAPEKRVTELADRFFEYLREERLEDAYAMLAASSRAETSREELEAVARSAGIVGLLGVAWDPPFVDGDFGSIEGVVTPREGAALRMKVVAFRRKGTWEIHNVHQPRESADDTALPDAGEAAALVHASVRVFIESVQRDNLTDFHKLFSENARKEISVEALREAFDLFFELKTLGADFRPLLRGTPVFDAAPALDENGTLALRGLYPRPSPVTFDLAYVREADEWKLVGFNLSLSNLPEWLP